MPGYIYCVQRIILSYCNVTDIAKYCKKYVKIHINFVFIFEGVEPGIFELYFKVE